MKTAVEWWNVHQNEWSGDELIAWIRDVQRDAIKAALEAAARVALRDLDGYQVAKWIRAIDPESLMGGGT